MDGTLVDKSSFSTSKDYTALKPGISDTITSACFSTSKDYTALKQGYGEGSSASVLVLAKITQLSNFGRE